MVEVIRALLASVLSLARPGLWRYLLAPAGIALLLWSALAWWGFSELVAWLMQQPPMTLLLAWGLAWLAQLLAWLGGWMAIFALVYLLTALLAGIFMQPALLDVVARQDYPELARLGETRFFASVGNSLLAGLLFILGWLCSLPLWLIPGLGLLLPLLLLAWFNRQTFAFDALAEHATPGEWQAIRRAHAGPLFLLGLILALLAHVPLLGLLVPALAALAYIHYGLAALRDLRGGALLSRMPHEIREIAHDEPQP